MPTLRPGRLLSFLVFAAGSRLLAGTAPSEWVPCRVASISRRAVERDAFTSHYAPRPLPFDSSAIFKRERKGQEGATQYDRQKILQYLPSIGQQARDYCIE